MANPFPFVAGDVLLAAELNGIGEASASFTATITNYTRGNGTSVARFIRINKLIYVYGKETLGSTSSVTGEIRPGFPFTSANTQSVSLGVCNLNDSGTLAVVGFVSPLSTTTCALRAINVSGTILGQGTTNATTPFTWTTGDFFEYSYVYEVA